MCAWHTSTFSQNTLGKVLLSSANNRGKDRHRKHLLGILCCFETDSPYVAQTSLELVNLSPQPPQCCDYSSRPPHPGEPLLYV
jgi:hypothetical protein